MSTLAIDTIQGATAATSVDMSGVTSLQMPAGHVVQTVSTQYSGTRQSTSSSSFVALTGLSASITPKFSTSKILIMTDPSIYMSGALQNNRSKIAIYRNGSEVKRHTNRQYDYGGSGVLLERPFTMFFIDSPSTTSSVLYQIYVQAETAPSSGSVILNDDDDDTSSLILQEIAQ